MEKRTCLLYTSGIRRACGLDTQIKWPNDVIIGGKKLCGILTEMSSGTDYVVIGIGTNVNVPAFPGAVSYTHLDVYKRQPLRRSGIRRILHLAGCRF